jgi:hypothetical protein
MARRGRPRALPALASLLAWAFALTLLVARVPCMPLAWGDPVSLERDLESASDPRVRARAALLLGHKPAERSARLALENALRDPAVVVRAAAAAGLGVMGERASIPAMRARLDAEDEPAVKSALARAIAAIEASGANGGGAAASTRWFLRAGGAKNSSAVRTPAMTAALDSALRQHMAQVPGVTLADSAPPGSPFVQMDGVLLSLTSATHGQSMTVRAEVEISLRKLPEHALRGTLTGSATSMTDPKIPRDALDRLRGEVIDGAVQSALRGAEQGLIAAAK